MFNAINYEWIYGSKDNIDMLAKQFATSVVHTLKSKYANLEMLCWIRVFESKFLPKVIKNWFWLHYLLYMYVDKNWRIKYFTWWKVKALPYIK